MDQQQHNTDKIGRMKEDQQQFSSTANGIPTADVVDRLNVSKDDSDVGEEYFLREQQFYNHHHPYQQQQQQQQQQQSQDRVVPNHLILHQNGDSKNNQLLFNLSMSPEYSQSISSSFGISPTPTHTTLIQQRQTIQDDIVELTTPIQQIMRTNSNNSLMELYGEGIVTSHHQGINSNLFSANDNLRPNRIDGDVVPTGTGEDLDHTPIPRITSLLQPQFRHNNYNEEIGSVSTNTESEENNYDPPILNHHTESYHSVAYDVSPPPDSTTTPTITPPTMQYPLSLSPPYLITDEHRLQQQQQLESSSSSSSNHEEQAQHGNSQKSSRSQDTSNSLNNENHNGPNRTTSSVTKVTRSVTPSPSRKKNRPPRAPTSGIIVPSTTMTTVPNASTSSSSSQQQQQQAGSLNSSGMSSIPITTNGTIPTVQHNNNYKQQQHHQHQQQQHNRVLSTGDVSILSALTTDSEYFEGGTNSGIGGGGGGIGGPNTTPDIHSSRSYVGLPSFRDSLRGRGGTRSLSGIATRNNRHHEQHHSLHYSPLQSNHNGNAMSGMNIDIPSCLQQPILDDKDNEIMQHPILSEGNQVDSMPPLETFDNVNGDNDTQSQGVSPMFHSIEASRSPNRVFLNPDEFNNDDKQRLLYHTRLSKISEYETEAETAILAAIDDEIKRGSMISMHTAIFPTLSRDEAELLRGEHEANQSVEGQDSVSSAFSKWYALQHTDTNKSDRRQPQSLRCSTAMDSLTDNAISLLDAVQHRNMKAHARSNKTTRPFVEQSETLPMAESDVADDNEHAQQDVDMDQAENGKHKPTIAFVHTAMQLPQRAKDNLQRVMEQRKLDWVAFEESIHPQKETVFGYMKDMFCFCIIPLLTLSCILFYFYDNPPTGRALPHDELNNKASISWWIIFVGVRHPLVLSLARAGEYLVSNTLGTTSPRFMKIVGPRVGLILAHSKGWPCVLLLYSVLCLQLLCGKSHFVKHWLFWYATIYVRIVYTGPPRISLTVSLLHLLTGKICSRYLPRQILQAT
jgi:hypothetical protein